MFSMILSYIHKLKRQKIKQLSFLSFQSVHKRSVCSRTIGIKNRVDEIIHTSVDEDFDYPEN